MTLEADLGSFPTIRLPSPVAGSSAHFLFQFPEDRRLAESNLSGYGFLAVSIGKADHYLFFILVILAAYPVVPSHCSILALYALGVIEYQFEKHEYRY